MRTGPSHDPGELLIVSSEPRSTRIARVRAGKTVSFDIELHAPRHALDGSGSTGDGVAAPPALSDVAPLMGSIWRARVESVAPAMHAAFVDLGCKDTLAAFLSAGELVVAGAKLPGRPDIAHLIKPGSNVIVQVTREASGSKGPRISMSPSLTGVFCVLAPFDERIAGVSRSMPATERSRLHAMLPRLTSSAVEALSQQMTAHGCPLPARGVRPGVVLRTTAIEADEEAIEDDIRALAVRWAILLARGLADGAPRCIAPADDLVSRAIRDAVVGGVARIVVDDRARLRQVRDLLDGFPGSMRPDLELAIGADATDVFRGCGVPEPEVEFLSRRRGLASGAWLAFDRTEALTVVDVNAGHACAVPAGCHERKTSEGLALSVNLEAVSEVARHVVARGITGAIVIDFIGLGEASARRKVVSALRDALSTLGAGAQVSAMSALGLVEVGRRGGAASLDVRLCEPCTGCGALGRRLTDEALVMLAERRIRRLAAQHHAAGDLLIGVSERLMALLSEPQYNSEVAPMATSALSATIDFAVLDGPALAKGRQGEGDVLFDDLVLEVLS